MIVWNATSEKEWMGSGDQYDFRIVQGAIDDFLQGPMYYTLWPLDKITHAYSKPEQELTRQENWRGFYRVRFWEMFSEAQAMCDQIDHTSYSAAIRYVQGKGD